MDAEELSNAVRSTLEGKPRIPWEEGRRVPYVTDDRPAHAGADSQYYIDDRYECPVCVSTTSTNIPGRHVLEGNSSSGTIFGAELFRRTGGGGGHTLQQWRLLKIFLDELFPT